MKTVLIEKNITENDQSGVVELKFFTKDKIDVTTHLIYNLTDLTQVETFHKSAAFFKVGKEYKALFTEIAAEAQAATDGQAVS